MPNHQLAVQQGAKNTLLHIKDKFAKISLSLRHNIWQ